MKVDSGEDGAEEKFDLTLPWELLYAAGTALKSQKKKKKEKKKQYRSPSPM